MLAVCWLALRSIPHSSADLCVVDVIDKPLVLTLLHQLCSAMYK